ncbi:hypothetical protein SETIT_2G118900v2 [Setaria italica]|uniref:DUF1618 domain-containing protein n=1 Tax=Setaria italica TaxID=4555 RepID=K3ZTC0_SETIT|nr:uncharacterized protein LOC111256453 [Setaria italica]RCV10530.1 hypothetical protein SETIT_2G118900v2 [Setaria italica]RCV10531.1 hypothetical protein SETIT_2G118900v2 [Setaria italica]
MATADAPAGSGGALPNWVMLDRFIFRRDDPQSFREDKRTSATGETSVGAHFRISFILAEPPTPSRLYLSWPGGPKREKMCHLASAHRNLVLLRLDSYVDPSNPSPFGEIAHDYFIYYVAADPRSQAQSTPALRRLPGCTVHNAYLGRPIPRPFVPYGVGLLCCGEEFVVAYLGVGRRDPEAEALEVELWVLRSTVRGDSADGGEKWEAMYLPIQGQHVKHINLLNFTTNEVVPFKNTLCWVDYRRGVLYCEDICGDSPKAVFAGFPPDYSSYHPAGFPALYRSLCVTEGGRTLAILDVGRHDGADIGRMVPDTGFTIVSKAVTETQSANSFVVQADDLWAAHPKEELPREVMMLPLMSLDDINVAHFVLYNWADLSEKVKVSLVTIDLSTKRVVGKVVPYIDGVDLSTDDADLVEAKPNYFMHFLPAEFPKFLNLQRTMKNPA